MRIALEAAPTLLDQPAAGRVGPPGDRGQPAQVRAITASDTRTTATTPSSWRASPPTIRGCCRPSATAVRAPAGPEPDPCARRAGARPHHARQPLRGLVKSAGGRLPACSPQAFPQRAPDAVPPGTGTRLPSADRTDRRTQPGHRGRWISRSSADRKSIRRSVFCAPCPASGRWSRLLRADSGPPGRPGDNRQAGAFLGLRPRQRQSGDSDPQHGIAKIGNRYLRSLLVQSAHYVLGRFGPDWRCAAGA